MTEIKHLPSSFQPKENCLKGKVILVTGAGDGIGKTAALTFARHGASVILLGRTLEKLEATYDEIESAKYPLPALCPIDLTKNDIREYEHVRDVIKDEFGKLDGLLHNAGVLGENTTIANYKADKWNEVMQVNLNAAFLLTKAMMPLLKHEDHSASSIVFTSSGVGRKGRAFWGAYAVSKFATEGLMQTLADELEDTTEIRANCINPGATRTQMRSKAYPAEDPQTLKTPEEIMGIYLYLMSDESVGVNGQTFNAQN